MSTCRFLFSLLGFGSVRLPETENSYLILLKNSRPCFLFCYFLLLEIQFEVLKTSHCAHVFLHLSCFLSTSTKIRNMQNLTNICSVPSSSLLHLYKLAVSNLLLILCLPLRFLFGSFNFCPIFFFFSFVAYLCLTLFILSFFNQFRQNLFPPLHIWSSGGHSIPFFCLVFLLAHSHGGCSLQPWVVGWREAYVLCQKKHPVEPESRCVPSERFVFASAMQFKVLPTKDLNADFWTWSNIISKACVSRPLVTYSLG